jgi:AraC family transcriptional regulator of adaptative response/methylated-DNA-[protein]-cysteine methyltransferase
VYERASSQFGMTPGDYKRGGESVDIAYAIASCPEECALGWLLVAATERGVCAVRLGDDKASLEDDLRHEFSNARLSNDESELTGWIEAIVQHLAGRQPHLELPLDIRATAFERMVWDELQRIPYGQTRTYSEIAETLGQPRATRAVANACGKNPTALVIPCHRVVRKDGSLGGYRWGVERKKAILAKEQSATTLTLES